MSGYSPDQAPIPDPDEGHETEVCLYHNEPLVYDDRSGFTFCPICKQEIEQVDAVIDEIEINKTSKREEAEAAFEAWLDSLPDTEF